ncbi:glycosyltransferase [Nitzschia inconspicua]|uniref:GDP-Man:Man(3)GlcNAc(2)-PP-Dol alpha-1,2-mannosyltransferase n=1 Tax=Nitzschia inconspicua TaxID=303405 RepID=A0A9K3PZL1_9STRA|nr:glycosyltransferase [Nitzschia inconspicua]
MERSSSSSTNNNINTTEGDNVNIISVRMMIIISVVVTTVTSVVLFVVYKLRPSPFQQRRRPPKTFAFFHPYASGGGGGERVLWKMIQFLQQTQQQQQTQQTQQQQQQQNDSIMQQSKNSLSNETMEIVIYTIDPPSTKEYELRNDAEKRFDVHIPNPIRLVSLESHKGWLQSKPFLSLVVESYGTMKLAQHALQEEPKPDVFCDTTGCAFTFATVRWMCPTTTIMAYVHYPTISTDMMLWEWKKHDDDDNNTSSSSSPSSLLLLLLSRRVKTIVKLIYYWFFAICYGLVGSMADLVMVNSTWTYNHIASLWRFSSSNPIRIVYPPCRVPDTLDHSFRSTKRKRIIVSIGQFRPEKNHKLQLEAMSRLLTNHPELRSDCDNPSDPVQLVLIGSCRNEADQTRLQELKHLAKQLDLQDHHIVFRVNPPYTELQAAMTDASVGIHTMRQEHFGIGIVEMMAAGLLVIAHDSGGPKSDIVQPGVSGFLATTAEEYADAMYQALTMDKEADAQMRTNAQQSAIRFSDTEFDKNLDLALKTIPWS